MTAAPFRADELVCSEEQAGRDAFGEIADALVAERGIQASRVDVDEVTVFSAVGFQKEGTLAFQNLSPLSCSLA